jgi:hypothetical protein
MDDYGREKLQINSSLRCLYGRYVRRAFKTGIEGGESNRRSQQLYETIFHQLLEKCQAAVAKRGGKKKFRFKNKLTSLDASTVDLVLSMFDWAKFRQTKGAIKLHMLLDHDGYLPSFAVITTGKTSDITMARRLHFDPGTILVIDRGYIDYEWFVKLTFQDVFFVTRLKDNAVYEVVEERKVPKNRNVLKDQIIFSPARAQRTQARSTSSALSRSGTRRRRSPSYF